MKEREGKMNRKEALRHLREAFLFHTRRDRYSVPLFQGWSYHTEEV